MSQTPKLLVVQFQGQMEGLPEALLRVFERPKAEEAEERFKDLRRLRLAKALDRSKKSA